MTRLIRAGTSNVQMACKWNGLGPYRGTTTPLPVIVRGLQVGFLDQTFCKAKKWKKSWCRCDLENSERRQNHRQAGSSFQGSILDGAFPLLRALPRDMTSYGRANRHSSVSHSKPKVETTQMSTNWVISQPSVAQPYREIALSITKWIPTQRGGHALILAFRG